MEQSRQGNNRKRGDLVVETKVPKIRRLIGLLATTFFWLLILFFIDFVIVSVIYHFRRFVPEYFHVIHLQIGWFGMSLGAFGAILLYTFFFFWVNARKINRKKNEEVSPADYEEQELAGFFELTKEEVQERRMQKLTVIKPHQNIDSNKMNELRKKYLENRENDDLNENSSKGRLMDEAF